MSACEKHFHRNCTKHYAAIQNKDELSFYQGNSQDSCNNSVTTLKNLLTSSLLILANCSDQNRSLSNFQFEFWFAPRTQKCNHCLPAHKIKTLCRNVLPNSVSSIFVTEFTKNLSCYFCSAQQTNIGPILRPYWHTDSIQLLPV